MNKETWLNGWYRRGTIVLLGTAVHCAGCGSMKGITTVLIPEDWQPPAENPSWPFDEEKCPVCIEGGLENRTVAELRRALIKAKTSGDNEQG